ncbi:MAG: DUF58 domain-containing protein [Desulfobacteraceae bacterium]|jgi:uncharacterized protein (DUF58 family)
MIIPTNRLILWTGLVFVPFSALIAVVQPVVAVVMSVAVILFLILVIADGFSTPLRLKGIDVELPDVIRLSKGKEAEISISIHNRKNRLNEVSIGIPFPFEMISAAIEMVVSLPSDSEQSSAKWPCRALKRGNTVLDVCYLGALSHLTFWRYRKKSRIRSEIRVYPDIFQDRKNIAFLFQNRDIGIHSRRLIGKGREFEQLREYMPGDSYEDIHWKATAKRRYPVTKVFQMERTQDVYVILDASRMSNRASVNGSVNENGDSEKLTILERYISASLILGLVTERMGDLFGLVAFSNNIDRFVKAKRGKTHFNTCRDTLYTLDSKKASPDFSELITFISLRVRHRALLIFLTSLDDPVLADNFIEQIEVLSKKHLVMVNMLDPVALKPLFSSPDTNTTPDVYRNLGRHMIHRNLLNMEKRLKKRGIGFTMLNNEKLNLQLISQYLNIKQKQLL